MIEQIQLKCRNEPVEGDALERVTNSVDILLFFVAVTGDSPFRLVVPGVKELKNC